MPRLFVRTLGCPKNEYDSEVYAGLFASAGWILVDSPARADMVLLNTCAFIAPAVDESMEAVAAALEWKRRKPGRRLALTGCLPGRFPDDGSGGLEDFDFVTGPAAEREVAAWLRLPPARRPLARARPGPCRFLRISDGCDNRCAYCTIPLIRGRFVPESTEAVLARAGELVEQGALEIGVVAQDTGMWRSGATGLTGLVERLSDRWRDTWFRIYYLHPAHIPRDLVGLIEDRENVMPWLDLPVQHASDRILSRMGRPYTRADLERLVDRVSASSREIAMRITVMTGYPGEEDSDFEELSGFLKGAGPLKTLVAFRYSPEEGTLEHSRGGRAVPVGETDRRLAVIGDIASDASLAWADRLLGRRIRVLVDDRFSGHSVWDAPEVDGACLFERACRVGTLVDAVVEGCAGPDLFVTEAPPGN